MPAAAVIPAPRAYTNIAAVKTLVVCRWVRVRRAAARGRRWFPPPPPGGVGVLGAGPLGGTQPPAVCPRARFVFRPAPARAAPAHPSPLQWGPMRSLHPTPAKGRPSGSPSGQPSPGRDPWSHHRSPPASHRGKLSVPQASIPRWAGCPSMECQSIDRSAALLELCWPWCPLSGERSSPGPPPPPPPRPGPPPGGPGGGGCGVGGAVPIVHEGTRSGWMVLPRQR